MNNSIDDGVLEGKALIHKTAAKSAKVASFHQNNKLRSLLSLGILKLGIVQDDAILNEGETDPAQREF